VTDCELQTHFLFIFDGDYGSIWLSFRDMVTGQTDDRQTTPLLKVSLKTQVINK